MSNPKAPNNIFINEIKLPKLLKAKVNIRKTYKYTNTMKDNESSSFNKSVSILINENVLKKLVESFDFHIFNVK